MNGAQFMKIFLVINCLIIKSSLLINKPPFASIPLIKLLAFLGPKPAIYFKDWAKYVDLTASLILIPTKHVISTKIDSIADINLCSGSKFWCLWIWIDVTVSPNDIYSNNGLWT